MYTAGLRLNLNVQYLNVLFINLNVYSVIDCKMIVHSNAKWIFCDNFFLRNCQTIVHQIVIWWHTYSNEVFIFCSLILKETCHPSVSYFVEWRKYRALYNCRSKILLSILYHRLSFICKSFPFWIWWIHKYTIKYSSCEWHLSRILFY